MRNYLHRMLENVTDNGFSCGGIEVSMCIDGNDMLTVMHYGTQILFCSPYYPDITPMVGGWSATEQTIINAVFEYYCLPFKCKRHGETLTIVADNGVEVSHS